MVKLVSLLDWNAKFAVILTNDLFLCLFGVFCVGFTANILLVMRIFNMFLADDLYEKIPL